jgi:hypothetical protein
MQKVSLNRQIGSVFVVVGTEVGAGVLALPILIAKTGFVIGSIIVSSDAATLCDPSLSVYRILVSSIRTWTRYTGFDHLLYLLCVITLRYYVSEDVIQQLSYQDELDKTAFERLYYINLFFDFLEGKKKHSVIIAELWFSSTFF